jgi:hypothetical protein
MADLFDQAQETDALLVSSALAAQRARAASTAQPDPTGECLNPLCGEPLDMPRLFCGPKCATEHARYSK